jgi:hypothetical protein
LFEHPCLEVVVVLIWCLWRLVGWAEQGASVGEGVYAPVVVIAASRRQSVHNGKQKFSSYHGADASSGKQIMKLLQAKIGMEMEIGWDESRNEKEVVTELDESGHHLRQEQLTFSSRGCL